MHKTIKDLLLTAQILFEGEGGGDGAGASGESAAPAAGEQTGANQSAAGSETPSPEERAKAWNDMIKGEYKDLYDADMQRIVKGRVAQAKELEQRNHDQQKIIDRLTAKYGVTDLTELGAAIDSDESLWESEADKAGMTVPQYMQFRNLQFQNDQLIREQAAREEAEQNQRKIDSRWREAQELKQIYPDFDLEAEFRNPRFARLVLAENSTIPLQHIYEVIHLNDIKQGVARNVASQTEKAVTDNIRAKGMRPSENGSSSHSAFTTTVDFNKMTLEEMNELNKKARFGKKIDFVTSFE